MFFFSEKKVGWVGGLFPKNLIFFKIGKGGKFAVECVSNDIFSQNHLFHLNCEVFFKKNQNYSKFGFKKKHFHLFKRHLQQNWRTENLSGSRPFCF